MSLYEENLAKHRRISVLRVLQDAGGATESLLFDCLESLGLDFGLTRMALRDDLKWMADRDLLRLTMANENVMVVHITERGVDCAKGRIIVDGVKKPSVGVA